MKVQFSHEMVQNIGRSVGIDHIDKHVAGALAMEVDCRVRELLQDSKKFMSHGRRKILTTNDIDAALKEKNVETVYGFSGKDSTNFTQVKQAEDLFYVDSPTITSESLYKPIDSIFDPYFCVHWLAMKGNQLYTIKKDKKKNSKKRKGKVEEYYKPRTTHHLSKENQKYLETLKSTIDNCMWDICPDICNSLRSDEGLNQVLPYVCQYFTETVQTELQNDSPNLQRLLWMARIYDSILISPTLCQSLDAYLHQTLPAIISCIVHERVCTNPETENQWELRDFCAIILKKVIQLFEKKYIDLRTRITEVLRDALTNIDKCLSTHYGCIVGLEALGIQTVRNVLMPLLEPYLRNLKKILQKDKTKKRSKFGVPTAEMMVQQAWFRVSGQFSLSVINSYDLPPPKKRKLEEPEEESLENPRKKRKLTHRNEISEKAIAKWKADESKKKKKENPYKWLSNFYGNRLLLYSAPKFNELSEIFI